MKLSEAIRLGSALRKQAFDAYFVDSRSCAIGAAAEAMGCAYGDRPSAHMLLHHFPALLYTSTYPCGCNFEDQQGLVSLVETIIIHLNDRHHWTRERIATWIETVERRAELIGSDQCFAVRAKREEVVLA
jgi:hypothetical protein